MSGLSQPYRPRSFVAKRRRRVAGLGAIAVGLLVLSGCSAVKPTALTVGDTKISRDTVLEDFKNYETALLATSPTPEERKALSERIHTKAEDGKAWSPDYAAYILSHRLEMSATEQAYAKTKAKTVTVSKQARGQAEAMWGDAKTFALLPKAVQERELRFFGQTQVLGETALKAQGTPEAFYKANTKLFVNACARHILVKTATEAKAIRAKIVSGDDFAELAKLSSTDTGSGANGGDLGCTDPAQFVPEFAAAIRELKLQAVSEPVQTQFGFHLIQVTERKPQPFEEVQTQLPDAMALRAQQEVRGAMRKAAGSISVDPAFGVVGPDRGGFPTITPSPAVDTGDTPVAAVPAQ